MRPVEPPTHGIGVRIRAARHLAGFSGVPELAAELQRRGVRKIGETKIRQMEREDPQQTTDYRDLVEIAEACKLDVSWFSADFSRLAEISDEPRKVIAREIAAAVARAAERRAGKPGANPPLQEEGP